LQFTIENTNPKTSDLNIGDIFYASDFQIFVTKAENKGGGKFSGIGWASIPAFQMLQIVVEFDNITLNTENQLIEGEVYSSYSEEKAYGFAEKQVFEEPIEDLKKQDGKMLFRVGGELKEVTLGEKFVLEDPNYIYRIDEEGNITEESKEETDYENMGVTELLEEAKKLRDEARDATERGQFSEAAELTERAIALTKRAIELGGQLVGFAKILWLSIQELIAQKAEEVTIAGEKLETSAKQVAQEADIINNKNNQVQPASEVSSSLLTFPSKTFEATPEQNNQNLNNSTLKPYFDAKMTYLEEADIWVKIALVYLVVEKYTEFENILTLEEIIKTEAEELFQKYLEELNKLEEANPDITKEEKEERLVEILKEEINDFVIEFVENELKDNYLQQLLL